MSTIIGGWKTINTEEIFGKLEIDKKQLIISGNKAIALGAFVAGCRFFAGYPITPSSEILHEMSVYLHKDGNGIFYQPEDELASIGMAIAGSVCGKKAMTATSGPGFSLMQEEIGWAILNEIPLVVVNSMRIGPSTGQPTKPASADISCMINGRHGDGGDSVIVLSPSSVEECFILSIAAFSLSEQFRMPVFIALDGYISGLLEQITIPDEITIFDRICNSGSPPFGLNGNTSGFAHIGSGAGMVYTGVTHDEYGKRGSYSPDVCRALINHLLRKQQNVARFTSTTVGGDSLFFTKHDTDNCDYLLISYGLSSRASKDAALSLRSNGLKIGVLDLKVLWPLSKNIFDGFINVKKIIIAENNTGQLLPFLRKYLPQDKLVAFNKWDGDPIKTNELIDFCLTLSGNKEENECVLTPEDFAHSTEPDNQNHDTSRIIRVKKEYPFCAGCGHVNFCSLFLEVLRESGLNVGNTIFTSGIGCGSIVAATLDADVIKTSHGRALNAARAVKLIYPNRMVITISGDGDLSNIGGNSLIHTAREKNKFPILCICLDNANYGMTGGQPSATTPVSNQHLTNHPQEPLNLKRLLYDGLGIDFFGITSTINSSHMKETVKKAIDFVRTKNSFAFVQVFSPCTTYSAKTNKGYFSRDNLQQRYGIWERDNES